MREYLCETGEKLVVLTPRN